MEVFMENLENEFEKLGYKKIKDDGKFLIYRKQNTYFGEKGVMCKKELVNKEYEDIKTIIFKVPNKRLFLRRDIVAQDYRGFEPFSLDYKLLDLVKKQTEILNFWFFLEKLLTKCKFYSIILIGWKEIEKYGNIK